MASDGGNGTGKCVARGQTNESALLNNNFPQTRHHGNWKVAEGAGDRRGVTDPRGERGDEVKSATTTTTTGDYWPSRGQQQQQPITSFSRGVSGQFDGKMPLF
ncbi:hypothetical protein niasHS_013175 [Heterodera schachtii]|uniref:Uncharacterized protein n=1 Tax=Heterodera schachtii TaxID=97005 RepID=A0ABD2II61_HETSC